MRKSTFFLKFLMGLLLMAFAVPHAQAETVTIGENATNSDAYVPLYGAWMDNSGTYSQTIYSSTMLSSMAGQKITQIAYYPKAALSSNLTGDVVKISLKEVDQDGFSSTTPIADMTVCGTCTIAGGETQLVFVLDNPFIYSGTKNLAIEVHMVSKGSGSGWASGMEWYYFTTEGNIQTSLYHYSSTTARNYQIPKTTFTYEAATTEPTIRIDNDALSFSAIVGNSVTSTVTVTGLNLTGNITNAITGTDAAYFNVSPTSLGTTGGELTITYAPTAAGNHSATLTLSSAGAENVAVNLSGTAEAPVTSGSVTPLSLNFNTYAGVSATGTITIENTGNQAFTPVFNVAAPFSIETATEIAVGASKDFTVTYTPTNVGTNNGTLTVDINGTTTNVTLSGTANEAPKEVTVAEDGTAQSGTHIPVEGTYFDTQGTYGQTIYSKSDLSLLAGKNITQVKYYSNTTFNAAKIAGTVLEIYLMETENDVMPTSGYSYSPLTFSGSAVGEYTVQGGETGIEFILSTPFAYSGNNNLAIQVRVKTKSPQSGSNYQSISWIGKSESNRISYYSYGSNSGGSTFLPKTTFSYGDAGGSVTVSPSELTFGGESFYAGQTEEKDVTVSNTTEEAVAVSITGDNANMFEVKNNVTSIAAGTENGTLTVVYKPTAAGTHTATLNVGGKTVTLTGTSEEAPNPTIIATPNALTMNTILGSSASATFTVTGTNLTGDIAVAANGDGFGVSPTSITAADAANGVTVTITYNPAAVGNHNGTVTLTSQGAEDVVVSLTGTCLEVDDYAVSVNPETGHNFGTVGTDQTVTWTIKVKNEGANAITPTLSALTAPYSTTYSPVTLAYGEETTIVISFAPTAIQTYPDVPVTLSFPGSTIEDYTFTLKGEGVEPTGTLPASFYEGIEYTWIDSENVEHTSTLGEVATDPDQMIALMREVYTNKALPGPFYRGYDANGNPETNYPVAYPAIGTVTRFGAYGVAENYTYNDAGWGITHDEAAYPFDVLYELSSSNNVYKALNGNEYKPNEDGLTLLLVEMKDGVTHSTVGNSVTSASGLRNVFDKMFKSVRVITHSKRFGAGAEAGTLFKIDCDKMNRFFFLGKGRLRLYNDAYYDSSHRLGRSNFFIDKKNQTSTSQSTSNVVSDEGPFFEMFEQFSPVSLSEGTIADDIYQSLINMESYGVEHDCQYIPWATTDASSSGGSAVIGHEFNMYGKTSPSEDCQDVRDLMFFIPDQRMKYWSDGTGFSDPRRDKGENDKFVNYYKDMTPTMALYVIRQNPITGEQKTYNGNENNFELHLTWESNLTSILPAAEGSYFIYQVNDDGTYTQVGTTDANTTELYLNVAMQEHGQQVTYVIQGQDKSKFLSLQMSNEESFIIPGTDPYEKFQLNPNADIYSRFDPAQVINFYANGMQVKTYPDATNDMFAGKTINYYRQAKGETEWTLVATANVNDGATAATATTVPATQRQQSEYKYGYKVNSGSLSITTDANGHKVFDNLYDNFKADVSANEHPDYYKYMIVVDGTPTDAGKYHSNEITVRIEKTKMSTIPGYFSKNQVDADNDHATGLADAVTFDIDVTHSSKTEILRYDAYRWSSADDIEIINQSSDPDNEQDIAPKGIAGNQGEYYTVAMNSDYVGEDVYVSQGQTNQATFVDNVPLENADAYTYAPVVETFAPTGWNRDDYNTYGAPLQRTAVGNVAVSMVEKEPGKIEQSAYNWNMGGETYAYYNAILQVDSETLIPNGYELYKVRAWREAADPTQLGEEIAEYQGRMGTQDDNGNYDGKCLFEELTYGEEGYMGKDEIEGKRLGGNLEIHTHETGPSAGREYTIWNATFGAKKLAEGEQMDLTFVVRAYFTRVENLNTNTASGAPRRAGNADADGKYYIAEVTLPYTVHGGSDGVVTAVSDKTLDRHVVDVTYFNMTGLASKTAFNGINVVVTRYSDGSTSTAKVLK